MLKKLFPKIGFGLSLILLFACEKEEEPESLQNNEVIEVSLDGQTYVIRDYLNSRSGRSAGLFYTEVSTQFYDAANNYYWVEVDLKRAKFLVPGIYKLPSDSISAFVSLTEPNGKESKFWRTRKNAPLSLTITEIKPNPLAEKYPNQNQSELMITGSFSFTADSVMKGNTATGSKTVSAKFTDLLFNVYNEVPNFNATINQKPWSGDANTEFTNGQSFIMNATNHWGDVIQVNSSQKVKETGTYNISSATYKKRMPNGTFQTWSLSNPINSGTITIEKSVAIENSQSKVVAGKISFTAPPVSSTGATGTITVNAAFSELTLIN